MDCIKTRIEARKRYVDGKIDTFKVDVYSHMHHCGDCNAFIVALKNGDLIDSPSPQTEPRTRKETWMLLLKLLDERETFFQKTVLSHAVRIAEVA